MSLINLTLLFFVGLGFLLGAGLLAALIWSFLFVFYAFICDCLWPALVTKCPSIQEAEFADAIMKSGEILEEMRGIRK